MEAAWASPLSFHVIVKSYEVQVGPPDRDTQSQKRTQFGKEMILEPSELDQT